MKITEMSHGLAILSKYANDVSMDPIPESFPNGAPDYSRRCYLSVEVGLDGVNEKDEALLRSLGWHDEQEGIYWVYPSVR